MGVTLQIRFLSQFIIIVVTLRVDGNLGSLVRHDGLVVVEQQLAGVIVVAAGEDGVGNLGGVVEGGGQSADLAADHQDLLGEEPLEEGPGLVSHAQDLHIVEGLPGRQLGLQLRPDVLVNVAVDSSGQASVRGHCHEQFLGLGLVCGDLDNYLGVTKTFMLKRHVLYNLHLQTCRTVVQRCPEVWRTSDPSQPWQTSLLTPSSWTV